MKHRFTALLLFISLVACNRNGEPEELLFTLLPSHETNVTFMNSLTEDEDFNMIEYLYFNNGAGVATGDINNDGLTDIYFVSNQGANKLYLNKGNMRFEDVTAVAGLEGSGNWKTGVSMADVNGDGLLDIYVCQVGGYKNFNGKNQLFINKGNLRFVDEAAKYNLDFRGLSTQAAFFDYDLDGDPDMYLLNHSVHTTRSYGDIKKRFDTDTLAGDRLYRNMLSEGEATFMNATRESGIFSSQIGYGLGVSISDFNNDGYPDIYISNDFHEDDYLYINNADGTFTENLAASVAHTSRSSMGNDAADFNNDGLIDILVLDMLPCDERIRKSSGGDDDYELSEIRRDLGFHPQYVRNTLQMNLGGGLFSEIGIQAGIHSTDWSWSPLFSDLDNDGWKDIFITSGIYRRANDLDYVSFLTGGNRNSPVKDNSHLPDKALYEKMPLDKTTNHFFRNNGDLTFSNENIKWNPAPPSFSNGSAYADLDNDGDLDLIVNNINDIAYIYRNNSDKGDNHYITLKLRGGGLNTFAAGARATLYSGKNKQVGELNNTRGFLSSSDYLIHFGTGSAIVADSIIVRWPDMTETILRNIHADTILMISQDGNSRAPSGTFGTSNSPALLAPARYTGLEFIHREDRFSDLSRERLMPYSLSAEGPALAAGDIDGDGLDDVFVGGAAGQEAAILIQGKDGTFRRLRIPELVIELDAEDTDAAIFDADGNELPDLYVVRGGNELLPGNIILTDLLLLNQGNGRFFRRELPGVSHNGSCVRPCDFDNDGDIDLFVGSSSVPSSYGTDPEQFLLENDGRGNFRNAIAERFGKNQLKGMIKDACWVDFDSDGDMDLFVAGEWMPLCLFRNDKGYFIDATASSGLENTDGWWHSLEVADIDSDGDYDIVAGNRGLNLVPGPGKSEPVELLVSDFDNNGRTDQVVTFFSGGKCYPYASLDEMEAQMPGFSIRFRDYRDYGSRTIAGIFSGDELERVTRKKVLMSESSVFINNKGSFASLPLPAKAQFSVVRDILVSDINDDGIKDILTVGNAYRVRPSYGRADASYGWILRGNGADSFSALKPGESGFIVTGDARKMVSLTISGHPCIIVALNNDGLKVFMH